MSEGILNRFPLFHVYIPAGTEKGLIKLASGKDIEQLYSNIPYLKLLLERLFGFSDTVKVAKLHNFFEKFQEINVRSSDGSNTICRRMCNLLNDVPSNYPPVMYLRGEVLSYLRSFDGLSEENLQEFVDPKRTLAYCPLLTRGKPDLQVFLEISVLSIQGKELRWQLKNITELTYEHLKKSLSCSDYMELLFRDMRYIWFVMLPKVIDYYLQKPLDPDTSSMGCTLSRYLKMGYHYRWVEESVLGFLEMVYKSLQR